MNRSDIKIGLVDAGLARIADELSKSALPCIELRPNVTKDDEVPIGSSKFGGQPDIPKGHAWPIWNDEPLAFLCQINLAPVNKLDTEGLLPSTGLLSFFYVADQSTWGFDPKDRGSWSVRPAGEDSGRAAAAPPV